jgi:hypothetical protein
METVEVTGADAANLAKAIYEHDFTKSNDLSGLASWRQPIDFWPDSDKLCQINAGPCGLFAVLQAHIILDQLTANPCEWDKQAALHRAVVAVFSCVSSHFFFCTDFSTADPSACQFTFAIIESPEAALAFVADGYLLRGNACALIIVGLVASRTGLRDIAVPEKPMIDETQCLDLMGVYWMLTGAKTEEEIGGEIISNFGECKKHPEIGLRVMFENEETPRHLVGTWLNTEAEVVVWHEHVHFTAVRGRRDADSVLYYDSLMRGPATVERLGEFYRKENVLRLE